MYCIPTLEVSLCYFTFLHIKTGWQQNGWQMNWFNNPLNTLTLWTDSGPAGAKSRVCFCAKAWWVLWSNCCCCCCCCSRDCDSLNIILKTKVLNKDSACTCGMFHLFYLDINNGSCPGYKTKCNFSSSLGTFQLSVPKNGIGLRDSTGQKHCNVL